MEMLEIHIQPLLHHILTIIQSLPGIITITCIPGIGLSQIKTIGLLNKALELTNISQILFKGHLLDLLLHLQAEINLANIHLFRAQLVELDILGTQEIERLELEML